MQGTRRFAANVCLLAMVSLASSAVAAQRNDDRTPVQGAHSQVQQQKAKPKGWVAKILDYLESKVSIPPA